MPPKKRNQRSGEPEPEATSIDDVLARDAEPLPEVPEDGEPWNVETEGRSARQGPFEQPAEGLTEAHEDAALQGEGPAAAVERHHQPLSAVEQRTASVILSGLLKQGLVSLQDAISLTRANLEFLAFLETLPKTEIAEAIPIWKEQQTGNNSLDTKDKGQTASRASKPMSKAPVFDESAIRSRRTAALKDVAVHSNYDLWKDAFYAWAFGSGRRLDADVILNQLHSAFVSDKGNTYFYTFVGKETSSKVMARCTPEHLMNLLEEFREANVDPNKRNKIYDELLDFRRRGGESDIQLLDRLVVLMMSADWSLTDTPQAGLLKRLCIRQLSETARSILMGQHGADPNEISWDSIRQVCQNASASERRENRTLEPRKKKVSWVTPAGPIRGSRGNGPLEGRVFATEARSSRIMEESHEPEPWVRALDAENVPQAVRLDRRRSGACLNCGSLGHMARDCPRARRGRAERTGWQRGVQLVDSDRENKRIKTYVVGPDRKSVEILLDTGAQLSTVTLQYLQQLRDSGVLVHLYRARNTTYRVVSAGGQSEETDLWAILQFRLTNSPGNIAPLTAPLVLVVVKESSSSITLNAEICLRWGLAFTETGQLKLHLPWSDVIRDVGVVSGQGERLIVDGAKPQLADFPLPIGRVHTHTLSRKQYFVPALLNPFAEGLFLQAELAWEGDEQILANILLDAGALENFIDEEFVQGLLKRQREEGVEAGLDPLVQLCPMETMQCEVASGRCIAASAKAFLTMKLKDSEERTLRVRDAFYVVKNLGTPILVGRPFLRGSRLIADHLRLFLSTGSALDIPIVRTARSPSKEFYENTDKRTLACHQLRILPRQGEMWQWECCGQDLGVLCDTGASGGNFISADAVRRVTPFLPPECEVQVIPERGIRLADGHLLSTSRMCNLPLLARGVTHAGESPKEVALKALPFFVLSGLKADLILGRETLGQWRFSLDNNDIVLRFPPKALQAKQRGGEILRIPEGKRPLAVQFLAPEGSGLDHSSKSVAAQVVCAEKFYKSWQDPENERGLLFLEELPQNEEPHDSPRRQSDPPFPRQGAGLELRGAGWQADGLEEKLAKITIGGSPSQRSKLSQLVGRWSHLFQDNLPPGLPPRRVFDLGITLTRAVEIRPRQIRLSQEEIEILREQLADLLAAGRIIRFKAAQAVPILFVRKADGTLRLCMDYRPINKVTEPQVFPLPRIDTILDQLGTARYFSVMDLCSGYHQLRVREDSIKHTAFHTPFGTFAWRVVPFGLSNAPAAFSALMADVVAPKLYQGVLAYLDDVIIYSETFDAHLESLEWLFGRFAQHQLYVKPAKVCLNQVEITFLGFRIKAGEIGPKPDKVEAILNFAPPRTATELRRILGVFQYYSHLLPRFQETAGPLYEILAMMPANAKTRHLPSWGEKEQRAFVALKESLREVTARALPNFSLPFYLSADASKTAVGAVLFQMREDKPTPLAFFSKRFSATQRNYPIWEKELAAVVWAVEHWRPYLLGATKVFVQSDHRSLAELLQPTGPLSEKQQRWLQKLAEYNLTITYIPGVEQVVADAFSRQEVLGDCCRRDTTSRENGGSITALDLQEALRSQQPPQEEIRALGLYEQRDQTWRTQDGLLYVPPQARQECIRQYHEGPLFAHGGVQKTVAQLTRRFTWKNLRADVARFVSSCHACQVSKPLNRPQAGAYQLTETPESPFARISMDFAKVGSSPSGADSVLTITCNLTGFRVLIPFKEGAATVRTVAQLFIAHFVRRFGFPVAIVSDRDSRFLSQFWQQLAEACSVHLAMSAARHPQSDGRSEKTNQVVLNALRALRQESDTDWVAQLPLVEYALNSSVSATTGVAPFKLVHGYIPPSLMDVHLGVPSARVEGVETLQAQLHQAWRAAVGAVEQAKRNAKNYADQRRSLQQFQPGDLVLVDVRGLAGNVEKLEPRYEGPFKVLQIVSNTAYKLDLPSSWRSHNVINQEYLKAYKSREPRASLPQEPETRKSTPPPVRIPDNNEYPVEDICDRRKRRGRVEYLVKWRGYPWEEASWEPYTSVRHLSHLLRRLENRLAEERRRESNSRSPRVSRHSRR